MAYYPSTVGYAYEALARAERTAGNLDEMEKFLISAHQVAATLTDREEKEAAFERPGDHPLAWSSPPNSRGFA